MACKKAIFLLGIIAVLASRASHSYAEATPYQVQNFIANWQAQIDKQAKERAEQEALRQAQQAARDAMNPANDLRAVSTVIQNGNEPRRVLYEKGTLSSSSEGLLLGGQLMKDEGAMDTGHARH